jgi:hypothetical protein
VLGAVVLSWLSLPVNALIMTGTGNQPVSDPGWPAGALAVANLPSRVGWMEGPPFGGGDWTFFYRGDTAALQQALEAFAAINAERREVVLHAGSVTNQFMKPGGTEDADARYDWSFEVWVPENWQRLFNTPDSYFDADHPNFRKPLAAPRLEIWLSPDRLDWARIKVPANIVVEDARATSHGFSDGSAIQAHVADAETGQPVASPRIIVTTNADGQGFKPVVEATGVERGVVELSRLPAGTYQIVATAGGYVPRVLEYGHFGTNEFKEFTVTLARPAVFTGQVLDEAEHPLAGVTIKARNTLAPDGRGYPMPTAVEAVSDVQGRFELRALPTGSFQIWAYLAGYHHHWNPAELLKAKPAGEAAPRGCIVRMEATGTVRIQLVDTQGTPITQLPAGGTQVHIQSAEGMVVGAWGGSANLETNGQYEFKDVPPGRYRISTKPFLPGQNAAEAAAQSITVEPRRTVEVKLANP